MKYSIVRLEAVLVFLAAAGLSVGPSAAFLCRGPAVTVSRLIADQPVPAGEIILEGEFQEAQLKDRFLIKDASKEIASITVFKSTQITLDHVHDGELVRVRGNVLPAKDKSQIVTFLLEENDGTAVAVCPDLQLRSLSTRRLAQSSGRERRARRGRDTPAGGPPAQPPLVSSPPSTPPASSPPPTPPASSPPPPPPESTPLPPQPSMPSSMANTWKSVKNLPLPMGEVSSGILTAGGKSYLVVVGEHPRGDSKDGVTMIFDLSKQTWIEASSRPEVGNHHASEVIENELYLFGGLSDGEGDIQIGTIIETEVGIDISWRKAAGLPFDGGSAVTALIGGKVYYCGGIDSANTRTVSNCAIYDPATDAWTTDSGQAPNMPLGRNHAASCTDGKKLFVFGGRSGRNVVGPGFSDTQILEPGTGWTTGKALPLARGGMGKAVFHDGKCFVFGGEVSADVAVSEQDKIETTRTVYRVDVYDTSTDSWSQAQEMPKGLHGIFPVKHNGQVHIAAGGTEAAFSQSQLHYVYTL